MNVRCEREGESPQRGCPGDMQRRRTRRTVKSIVLVPNVRRVHSSADHPCGQPPQAHMIGVSERSEYV